MKIIRIYSFSRHSPFTRVTKRREQKLKIKIISWPPDDFFPALALKQIERRCHSRRVTLISKLTFIVVNLQT